MSMARVQSRGQVTVPQDVREACGVEPGRDILFVTTGPNSFECWVMPPTLSLEEIFDRFSMEGLAPSIDELREEIGEALVREYERDMATPTSRPDP
jgi:bifunctional DNA-binding transcriptional regulator/antitoxin component of YhaV-PrlF toxin-antitoxin module